MHRVTLRRASGECGTVLQCIDRCCSASIIFLSINPRSLFLFCFGCLALAPFVMFEQVAASLSHNRDLDIILSILYLCSALTAVSAFPLPFPLSFLFARIALCCFLTKRKQLSVITHDCTLLTKADRSLVTAVVLNVLPACVST